jgi:hypothetical protein
MATENALLPPTGLLAALMRWPPLKRTAFPPDGVALSLRIGCSPDAPLATRLLALFQVPIESPSLNKRSSARQASIKAALAPGSAMSKPAPAATTIDRIFLHRKRRAQFSSVVFMEAGST